MPDNPLDINYGTQAQVEYAREMAKYLRSKKKFQMTPGMAVLPGSWAHGLGDVVDAISQGRYQDIAGQQDRAITDRKTNPNAPMPRAPSTVGSSLADYLNSKAKQWFGGGEKTIPPGTEPKDLTTGSLPDEKTVAEMEPKAETNYADLVKLRENPKLFNGEIGKSKAQWDFKQHTNGYGTKAAHETEEIGKEEADNRFNSEWSKAESAVDKFKPGLPVGPRAALTSLTFNSGTKWMKDGLGAAVQADDPAKAKELFLQYNKATDSKDGKTYTMAGLKERRNQEAQWFDDVTPRAPTDKFAGRMNLGGPTPPSSTPPQGEQLAQAFTTQPVGRMPPKAPIQGVPGGYEGVVPPRNPVSDDEQLKYQMRGASPTEQQAIIEQQKKDVEGRTYDTPGGGKLRVPGDPTGQVTHIPGADIPDFMGLGIRLRQKAGGGFELITPSGEKIPNTVDGLNKWKAELEAQRKGVGSVFDTQLEPVTEAIKKGNDAPSMVQKLNAMETVARASPSLDMGPTSQCFVQAKRLFSNFFGDNPNLARDIASADTIEKLNGLLASEQTKTFTNRGTNFDLQTFMRTNASLGQSKEGFFMILDILKQEAKQAKELGAIANKYRGKDPETWNARRQEYYEDNPIILNMPNNKGGHDKITTKPITTKEERDALAPGTKYIRPDGSIGTRP